MQIVAELLTAFMVWLAAAVLSQFGVDVDLDRQTRPIVERVIDNREAPAAREVSEACPEARMKAAKAPLEAA